jgi:NitT/TauT family transport system ATP-binding protein
MIRFEQVSITYNAEMGVSASPVLAEIDLHIHPGELVCILGASGCGKTTLLNLAAGFLLPTTGYVMFDGQPVRGPGPERGMVFQDSTLFPWLTVYGNIAFALKQQGVKGHPLQETTNRYLSMMDLSDHAAVFPCALSGGMRQRVAIARVLAMQSPVMLMDEPFSALDTHTRERLQDELLHVHQNNRQTILYVTHSISEAAYLGDRIIVLNNSRILSDIAVVLPRPRRATDQSYLGLQDKLRGILSSAQQEQNENYLR